MIVYEASLQMMKVSKEKVDGKLFSNALPLINCCFPSHFSCDIFITTTMLASFLKDFREFSNGILSFKGNEMYFVEIL